MNDDLLVAILLPSLKFGGAERAALNLASAFKAKGMRVDLLLMSNEGELLSDALSSFNVVDMECGRTWKLPFKLVSYLRDKHPVALISSFWKLNLCSCISRIFSPKTRLLLWEHSLPSMSGNSPKWLYAITSSLLYRLASRVICVSSGVRDDIKSITVGLGEQLKVIHNPIEPPDKLSVTAASARDGRHLIWVGRLELPKNPRLALEAFALVVKNRDVFLQFIGDGALRQELVDRCNELQLQDRVEFMGFRNQPYDFMQSSDVLILSSKTEGLGNVLIEALHCGLGVVSTDSGQGVRDVLLDDTYGRVVPNDDVSALAFAIEQELDSFRGLEHQQHGAKRFLPEAICDQFLEVICT